mmetsp:Transcript_18160/g.51662  ORF Transcript_18160/g.51662 Transcript_18160/m.51662 type:complete len:442 (+) Transcript_18160:163-1488(+)
MPPDRTFLQGTANGEAFSDAQSSSSTSAERSPGATPHSSVAESSSGAMQRQRRSTTIGAETMENVLDDYRRERDAARAERDAARAERDAAQADLTRMRARQTQNDDVTLQTSIHQNGQYFGGTGANGQPEGTGVLMSPDGAMTVYFGQWQGGARHGRGKHFSEGTLVYDGEWSDNTRHGLGEEFDAKGQLSYTGGWEKGRRHGRGAESTNGKVTYTGGWKDGEKRGFGEATGMRWEGQAYHGPTVDGDPHGEGELRCGAVTRYRGGWRGGKRHGWGRQLCASGGLLYEGEWANGERTYRGEARVGRMKVSGGHYCGLTRDGEPHGEGELRDGNNKPIYKGEWKSGKRHGQAKAYYHFDGPMLWFDGEWREGLARSGTLFPDGDRCGLKNADGIPRYPITPIRWQAGQDVPETDLRGVGGWKLHWWLQNRGVSRYFPAGALS